MICRVMSAQEKPKLRKAVKSGFQDITLGSADDNTFVRLYLTSGVVPVQLLIVAKKVVRESLYIP